ncbi:uncharacterized protein DDB_G0290301-like isoform X3 [Passer domesticus]|uniref:uncharacterized protein DDB_G0290301-like isoform X3 n=1 Tax=Passer domesticus TaxID=48849 RepID=UPI0030FEC2D7
MASQNHLVLLSLHVPVEKKQEQMALSEMPCQAQGELFPARDQEEQLRKRVEEPQQNGQNIKSEPQAELPEAQSAIMAVERRKKEDMRRIQEEIHLHQHRGDQQKQVSGRVAATSLRKLPMHCCLQTIKEDVQAELQESEDRNKERVRRLEEEMKIVREEVNPLLQGLQNQVQVSTSHLAACKDFQQTMGNEGPQGRMVTMENPAMKYMEQEHISSGSFGDVVRALNNTTGGEHNVYCKLKQDEQSKNNVMRLWEHPC